MRPLPIFSFLDSISAVVAAAEAAFANAVARQPPPPPPTNRTALPLATPINAVFVPPVILPPPPEIETQGPQPIQLVSYKAEPKPQVPDGEQIRKDVIAGKSIDVIAGEKKTSRENVIAAMQAAGLTVSTTDPSGRGAARATTITDPKNGQVVTEHTDFDAGTYYVTVKGADGKETSTPLRDESGWKVTSSRDDKTGAITTRREDDLGTGQVTEETRFTDGTVVEKTTPKGGATTTAVTPPAGKKVTLDPKQDPVNDAAGIRADVLAGKSLNQIALERGLTTEQVTAGLAVAGYHVKTENGSDGYLKTTSILDRNGKEVAGYTNDSAKGEVSTREIDAKGNTVTTVTSADGTVKKTVAEPNGRKTETTTEPTKDGKKATTTVVTFNGYSLTSKPDGSIILTDTNSGNKLNIKPGSVDESLAKTLMELDPKSSDPAAAKKAQVAKTVIEGMLAEETIPGLEQAANQANTDTKNAVTQYGPGQVGANFNPQNPYGDRPAGKAPSGGDWVPMNGVWMDPKVAQAIAAENTALSKLSEAQAKARQGQAQYEVYALDPAYKDAIDGSKSIVDGALDPFNLVWTPSKPEGILAEAQQRLTEANEQSTEASRARGEYESAQKLLNDAIAKQATLPPIVDPRQQQATAQGSGSNRTLDAANAKAAHAEVDAMFYGVRLHTANGDKLLSDYMVDLRQGEFNATKPGTPENAKAQQALTDARGLQSKAADQQTAAQVYYNYFAAQGNLTQLQAQATGLEQQLYGGWIQKNPELFEEGKEFTTYGGDYLGKVTNVKVYVDAKDHQVHVEVEFEHGKNDHQLTGTKDDIGEKNADSPLNQQWQSLLTGTDKNRCGLDGLAAAEAATKSTGANLNKTLAEQLQVDIKDLDARIPQLKSDLDKAIGNHGIGTVEAPPDLLPVGVKPVKVTVDGVDVWVSPDDADDVGKNGLHPLAKSHRPVRVELNGEWRWVDGEVAAAQVALKSTQDQRTTLETKREALVRAQHWNEFQLTQPMALMDDSGAEANNAQLKATYLDEHRDQALAGYQVQFGQLYDKDIYKKFQPLSGDKLDQAVAEGLNLDLATDSGRNSLKTVTDAIHELGGNTADVKIVPVYYVDGTVGSQQTGLVAVKTGDGIRYVDVTGLHFDGLEDFQNNNRQFSEHGKLVIPRGLEMSKVDGKIALDVVEARHVSTWDKVADPLIGLGTGIATVASFTPAAPVAAWFAIAGGTYLGAKAGYNEFQYLKHGGDWRDGESLGNLFSVATSVLPVGSGSLRLITLAKSEIPVVTASRIAFGAVKSSTPHLQEAQGLMQASVWGGQGAKLMRTARGLDGTAIIVGVPQIGMSLNQMSQFQQMSGLDQANAIMGLGIGIYGTGMGYLHLRTSRVQPRAETESETLPGDLPPKHGARTPQSLSAAYHPAGEPLPVAESPIPPAFRRPQVTLPQDPLVSYRPGDPTRPLDSLAPATPLNSGTMASMDSTSLVTSLMNAGVSADTARLVAAQVRDTEASSLPPVQIRWTSEPSVPAPEVDTTSRAYQRNPSVLRARVPNALDGVATTPEHVAPTTVFRGDTRSPDTIFTRGFSEENQPDPYGRISTSVSARDSRDFAAGADGGWVYTIVSDVSDGTLVSSLPFKGRNYHAEDALDAYEIPMQHEVAPTDILAARPVDSEGNYIGEPVYNSNFKDPSRLPDEMRGVIRLVDEQGRPFEAQVIGRRPVSADKVYVPPEDGSRPVLEDGTPLWAFDPGLMSKSHIVARDPATGEKFVVPWVRGAADPAKGSTPQPIPVDQLRQMPTDDVGNLSLSDIILFTDEHAAVMSNKQWGAFGDGQIAAIPEDAIPGIPPGRLARWRPDQTAAFTDGQLAALTNAQVRKLTLDQFGAFSQTQVGILMDHHVTVLRPAQIGRLSTDQMAAVTPRHLSQFTESQIRALTSAQLAHLTTEQMATFTPDRIVWLDPEQIGAFAPEQIRGFSLQQIAALKPAQVMRFSDDQLGALTLDQVRALTKTQISALRPSQLAALSPEQVAVIPHDRLAVFSANQLAALSVEHLSAFSGDQVAVFSEQQKAKLSAEQRAALEGPGLGKPVADLTNKNVAGLPLTTVHKLTPDDLATFSTGQLRAFTGEQIAVITDGQTARLSAEQSAALDAKRKTGVRKALSGLISEARQNGMSYLAMGGSSLVFGYATSKLGVLPWFNSGGYLIRGTGFIMQAGWPNRFGADTKWAPRFAKIYAATFMPNVYSGTAAMFDPVHYTPGVYIPFGIGSLPFAAQQAHYAIKGEPARAPLGNHLGYAGYTLGSGWYVYDTIWGAEVGGALGPVVPASSAVMFQLGSELWVGSWIAGRQANRDSPRPGTSRNRLDDLLDSIVLDKLAPRMDSKGMKIADRIAFGAMYGGGLVLFGAMGFASLFKAMADDSKKAPPATPSTTPTPTSTATPTPTQTEPPRTPPTTPPVSPPVHTREPEPRFVVVGPWRADGSAADNSTLWDVAGNNLDTLMSAQQKREAQEDGLSIARNRDALIADYGLPVLIDINDQYPLARNPDLIEPGWKFNVGPRAQG